MTYTNDEVHKIISKNIGILKGIPKIFEATRYHSLMIDRKTLSKDLEITAETLMRKISIIVAGAKKRSNKHWRNIENAIVF